MSVPFPRDSTLTYSLNLSALTTNHLRGLSGSVQLFWLSREPVAWPWCYLAASQRRPHCASVNSHSPVGLVSRQWDAVDWACVLCDRRIHTSPSFQRRFWLWEKPEVAGSQIWSVGGLKELGDAMFCPPQKLHESCRIGRRIDEDTLICSLGHCECDGHTVHKLSQRRLTADWLAPQESDCSGMCSKVFSDLQPSYIKFTWLVLEILKMARYFPDRPRTHYFTSHLSVPFSLSLSLYSLCPFSSLSVCLLPSALLRVRVSLPYTHS